MPKTNAPSLKTRIKTVVFFKMAICSFSLLANLAFAAAPAVETVMPASGSTAPEIARTFTCAYSDADGWTDLKGTYLLISASSISLANSVYLYYDQNSNLLYLRNDADSAWLGGRAPAGSNIIENSQVKLDCALTTVSGLANTLTVNWNITFKPAYSGKAYKTYLRAVDDNWGYVSWAQKGFYSVNRAPALWMIIPSSGTGEVNAAGSFTAVYLDSDGWRNIRYAYFLMNTSAAGANCLYAYYDQNTNKLYLRDDANSAWTGGYAPGSSYVIENSYAKLDCANTSISGLGNTLTINWSAALKPAFTGAKKTYIRAIDDLNAYAGWTQKGVWTLVSDMSPPSTPLVTDEGITTVDLTRIYASWSSADPETGIAEYEYSIGTAPSGADVVTLTSTGSSAFVSKTGLSLIHGQIYYVSVRAKNGAGDWSEWGLSDGIYGKNAAPVINDIGLTEGARYYADSITSIASVTDPDDTAFEYQYSLANSSGGRFEFKSHAFSSGGGTSGMGNYAIKEAVIGEAIGFDSQVTGYKLRPGYVLVYRKTLELMNQIPPTVKQVWTPLNSCAFNLGDESPGKKVITVQVKDSHGGQASKQAEVFIYRRPVSPPRP